MAYKNVLNLELTMIMEKGRLINCLNANVFPKKKRGSGVRWDKACFHWKWRVGELYMEFETGLSNKVNGTLRKSFYWFREIWDFYRCHHSAV